MKTKPSDQEMNTTPRPPLLSDADLGYVKDTHTPEQVRDFYENLITTGKLRVVEEVEYGNKPGLRRICLKCKALSEEISVKHYVYCPGCGNKIKR